MNAPSWHSNPIRVATRSEVNVDVRANADAVVIGQSDGVWFHDLHLTDDEHVIALINDLQEALVQKRSMRSRS